MATGEVKTINGKRVATPEYRSWQMMKNRVNNPKASDAMYYGSRGVDMDPRWSEFDSFLADMGRKPTAHHTLDRIDVNKGYWPGNCRWATRKEQARNRNYVKLTVTAATKIRQLYSTGMYKQVDLAKQYNVSQALISQIIRNTTWG